MWKCVGQKFSFVPFPYARSKLGRIDMPELFQGNDCRCQVSQMTESVTDQREHWSDLEIVAWTSDIGHMLR